MKDPTTSRKGRSCISSFSDCGRYSESIELSRTTLSKPDNSATGRGYYEGHQPGSEVQMCDYSELFIELDEKTRKPL